MSEVETRGDANQKDAEDNAQSQQQQQQQESYRELSDDNPIENDVEHTTDDVPVAREKSASGDSGAEEVGSPEQQITHTAGIYTRAGSHWHPPHTAVSFPLTDSH